MNIKINDNLKAILIVLAICIAFYLILFIAWNFSGENKPSSFFWDNRRDGYQEDPLYDRKK